jgi:hypothetical protein
VIVNDYRWNDHADGSAALADLDKVTEEHYGQWEDRSQPTRPADEPRSDQSNPSKVGTEPDGQWGPIAATQTFA